MDPITTTGYVEYLVDDHKMPELPEYYSWRLKLHGSNSVTVYLHGLEGEIASERSQSFLPWEIVAAAKRILERRDRAARLSRTLDVRVDFS